MENNYQLSRIHNYVMGLMSREEMHTIEKEALEDPFLQDAIDGYRLQHGVDSMRLSLLQKRLAERVEQKSIDKSKQFYSWQRLAVGTVAAVMFVVVCSLILFRYIGAKDEKTREVILMEQEYRIHVQHVGKSDAKPAQGWESFNEELNSELKDFKESALLQVSFVIQNGAARNVEVLGTNDAVLEKFVSHFIADKTKWEGKSGHIEIQMNASYFNRKSR